MLYVLSYVKIPLAEEDPFTLKLQLYGDGKLSSKVDLMPKVSITDSCSPMIKALSGVKVASFEAVE